MLDYLSTLPRSVKRAILLGTDLSIIVVSLYCALCLRYGMIVPADRITDALPLLFVLIAAGFPIFELTGTNRIKVMAFDVPDMLRSLLAAQGLVVVAILASYAFDLMAPRSVPLIFGAFFLMFHVSSRVLAIQYLHRTLIAPGARVPVAIFGAGSAGVQLAAALRRDRELKPIMFVDDNVTLQAVTVSGLPVRSRSDLLKKIEAGEIARVILALPSLSESARRQLIDELSELGCEVFTLPSYGELLDGSGFAGKLEPVTPDMLLGRDKVNLETPEVARAYAGRRVLVTGAGGSIGSELCRQILRCGPQRVVLLDHSEFALYSIHKELTPIAQELGVDLIARLGFVCDRSRVDEVLRQSEVDIVLHAAAYKHVPLVEDNELEGVRNNVFGTQTVAEAALAAEVERFILISTDKAVRPTNVMGASKRLAELVIQDLQTRSQKTCFSMVRFGNVLGSSGSVIPLFQDQIRAGGPVTVTHDKVTRYFMTIPEASRLVLLAGAYANGGDVFVLDMGEPVNIGELAKRMIELSGLVVKDESNPNGDIEIEVIGLRPGEKLYEELLIGENMLNTPHEKILRAQEHSLSEIEMARVLQNLKTAVSSGNSETLRPIFLDFIDGYHQETAKHVN